MRMQLSTKDEIRLAIEVLSSGGVVAFPTDTVYGIGANSLLDHAVEKVYQVKRRPPSKPLQLFLADVSEIAKVASLVPEVAWRLAERFLPGGLTLILRKAPTVSSMVTAGGDTIAVRISNHPIPIALVRGLGAPLAASSANLSGKPSAVTAEEVCLQLGEEVDVIIDGGRCLQAIESTVLDLTGECPKILRQGAVPSDAIREVCGTVVIL